uniref:Uncharacterized protein n=1 Tax=Tanacetum cinerariifolium TaxID=118510 RepID=A0A699GSA7_TANCI|nr:hypothetical protein [Tanacetum cinerariifolium]
MGGPAELNLTPPTSDVRNTVGREKEETSKNPDRLASDATFREYCDKHYHQLLPIIAEKVHNEKMQQEKLKEVKARLNFEGCFEKNLKIQEVSQHFESRTLDARDLRRRLGLDALAARLEDWNQPASSLGYGETYLCHLDAGNEIKEEGIEMCSIGWGIKEEVCPHTQKATTSVSFTESRAALRYTRDDEGNHGVPSGKGGSLQTGTKESTFNMEATVGHNTDECMHLKRKVEELIKNGKLSHVIKELKQGSEKDQPKTAKRGQILLPVKIGDVEHFTSTWMNFVVVRSLSPYNRIIGRPGLRKIQAVPSIAYGMLKFPVPGGILTLRSSKIMPLECTMVSRPEAWPFDIIQAAEKRIKVAIHLKHLEQTIAIGSTLTEEGWKALCDLLRRSIDVFAWKLTDMTGVLRHIAEHRLNVREGCSPLEDVRRFKDLNKACPKDSYPLLEIDWKNVRATYHYLVDKPFQKQIGRNLEEYVDDLVIKSRTEHEIIRDIEETFKTLREINIKLNPKKCTFGIEEGTFLRYKVNTDGIMTAKAKAAFKEMKKLIAKLPTLTAPMEKEELIVYLAAAREAVSAVLMTDRGQSKCQSTLLAAPYKPIKQILSRPEFARRLQKWKIELDDSLDTPMETEEELLDPWTLFTDGSSCIDGSGAGLIFKNAEGAEFTYALRFRFDATNNEVEYEALIVVLRITEQMGVKNLQANMDTRLVANQVNRSYIAKEPGMIQYLEKVKVLSSSFKKFSIKQVPRSENKKTNALSKIASTSFAYLIKQVLVKELKEKSINEAKVLTVVEEEGDTWMTPIYNYLTKETLLAEKEKAIVVRCKSGRSLGEGIKARLDERSKDWIEELPHVLWAHRIMIKSSNGDTPLSLTYEIEVKGEQAAIREAKSKAKMEKYYNSKVRNTSFKPGDLVYRSNEASHAKKSGKLSPKWEGPYEVTEALGNGVYKLRDHNGKLLSRTWNVRNLKQCYIHEM